MGVLGDDDTCRCDCCPGYSMPSRNICASSSPSKSLSSTFCGGHLITASFTTYTQAKHLRKENPLVYQDAYAESERNKQSFSELLSKTLYRPVQMLIQEPILVLITIYLSAVYGVLYSRTSFPPTFSVRMIQTALITPVKSLKLSPSSSRNTITSPSPRPASSSSASLLAL